MPRVSEAHLAARRVQIVEAARILFTERGFARTTMNDVVSASGLSMGAVYRYFPSKSELVLAVCAGHGGEVDGELLAEEPDALIARLADYVAPGRPHARMAVQIWGEAAIVPKLAEAVVATHCTLEQHLASLVRDRYPNQPDDTPPEAIAQTILAALIGLAALSASGVPADTDHFLAAIARLLGDSGDHGSEPAASAR